MIEGSGSGVGSEPLTNESGSRMPKNTGSAKLVATLRSLNRYHNQLHITLLYLILRLIGSWGGERLAAGQIGIVRGRVAQDEHRLLPLQLGQLVQDVQQLLQVVFEGLQRGLLTPRPHGAICKNP
jgi:hypothetical protein